MIPIAISAVIGVFFGYLLGRQDKILFNQIKEMREHINKEKIETGITPGLYSSPNEGNVNQDGDTGFVSPKTPQRLEWEEQERLREQQLNVKVK